MRVRNNDGMKIVIVSVILVFLVLSFFIVKNYIGSMLTGLILVFILAPIYNKLLEIFKSRRIAAIIICFMIVFVILGLSLFLLNSLLSQASGAYSMITKFLSETDVNNNMISIYMQEKFGISVNVNQVVSEFFSWIIGLGQGFISTISDRVLGFVVVLFSLFYLLNEKDSIISGIVKLLPIPEDITNKYFNEASKITYALIFGIFVTGIVQGIVAGIGYFIFGVKSALFWAVLTIFLAWIPIMGPPFVYIPLGISMIVVGLADGTWYRGILVLIYGVFIVSTVDNVIRPKLVGDRANVNPLIIFIGILGGINLFGFIGIIIGPIILELFFFTVNLYFDFLKEQQILEEKEKEIAVLELHNSLRASMKKTTKSS